MAVETICIDHFLALAKEHLIIDVRSPSEFQHAHIPQAISLPLFEDEERKVVGTTYKQQSREKAIKVGLDFFGPKMKEMVNSVEHALLERDDKTLLVHCWRGGMRSAAVAWLLDIYGFKVYTLKGGYKAFRNWVLAQLEKPYKLRILGGFTGSGKTDILLELAKTDISMVDLEGLSGHKGSAFGDLGLPAQPSSEQFENKLALALFDSNQKYPNQPIWVENESSRIGNIHIHHLFFNQMKTAKRVEIVIPLEARLDKIVQDYGSFDKKDLMAATLRIQRRLGGAEAKDTLRFLEEGNTRAAFDILIRYYDKGYKKNSVFLPPIITIELPGTDAVMNTAFILKKIKK